MTNSAQKKNDDTLSVPRWSYSNSGRLTPFIGSDLPEPRSALDGLPLGVPPPGGNIGRQGLGRRNVGEIWREGLYSFCAAGAR